MVMTTLKNITNGLITLSKTLKMDKLISVYLSDLQPSALSKLDHKLIEII